MSRPTGVPNLAPKHSTPEHGALWETLHRAGDWVTADALMAATGLHRNTVRKTTVRWAGRGWLERVNGVRGRPTVVRLTDRGRTLVPAWLEADGWCRP